MKSTRRRASAKDSVDVPADDPEHTMDRFSEGLRRVLAANKPPPPRRPKPKREKT